MLGIYKVESCGVDEINIFQLPREKLSNAVGDCIPYGKGLRPDRR